MSAEVSDQNRTETRYDTADSALRRRSVGLVRTVEGRDVRWIVELQLAGSRQEVAFNGLKSRPAVLPSDLRRHLAGISGGKAVEPQRDSSEPEVDGGANFPDTADAPAALTLMLQRLSDQLLAWDLAVRLDLPDAVHQLRVTCRSLRALLKAAAPFLERTRTDGLGPRLRDLARRCAPARDAEVTAELLPAVEVLDGVVRPDAVERLQRRALQQFSDASHAVRRRLEQKGHLQLLTEVQAFALHPPFTDRLEGRSSRQLANRLLKRSLRSLERVAARSPEGQDSAPAEDASLEHAHDVRKAVKRVRYVSAVLQSVEVRPGKKLARAAEKAKMYQRELGELVDAAVLLEWLARTAGELEHEEADRYDVGLLQGASLSRFRDRLRHSEVLINELAADRHTPSHQPPTG